MVKGFYKVLLLVNILGLTACSVIQSVPDSANPAVTLSAKQAAWDNRQVVLNQITSWVLSSKAALRYDDESVSFGLNWSQKPGSYEININNPLTGALVSKLTRNNNVVTLLADDGKTYRDNDEERLLKSQTNLSVPLKGMQYWVRGVALPESKVDHLILDNIGRPKEIQQSGWKITYTSYFGNDSNALPKKMNLLRGTEEITIKLVAKNWK